MKLTVHVMQEMDKMSLCPSIHLCVIYIKCRLHADNAYKHCNIEDDEKDQVDVAAAKRSSSGASQ